MDVAGWAQIALFIAVLTGAHPADRRLHGARLPGRDGCSWPACSGPSSAAPTACFGVDPHADQDWKRYARSVLAFSFASWLAALPASCALQGIQPWNPDGFDSGAVGRVVQHRVLVRHEHELAVLRRRDRRSRTSPDGRPRGPELRLGRRRHRRGDRRHPRHRAARSGTSLGNFWVDLTRALLYVLLPISLVDRRSSSSPRATIQTLGSLRQTSQTLTGGTRRCSLGPGRLPGGDQGARDQRRRLLQRQLGDAVREPDRPDELRRDAAHPRHPGGADRDLRPDGRQPPPGLGDLRRDARPCSSSGSSSSTLAEAHGSPAQHLGAASPAATSRARSSGSASAARRSGSRSPP